MYHRLHLARCFRFGRKDDARIIDVHRTIGQAISRLLQNSHRLPQLLEADEITVVDIAVRPDRYLEVVGLVVEIGEILADIVVDTGRAKHRPRQSPVDGFFRRHHAKTNRPTDPDCIPGEYAIDLIQSVRESADELTQPVHPAARYVRRHAADTSGRCREPRSNPLLDESVDLLTALERP